MFSGPNLKWECAVCTFEWAKTAGEREGEKKALGRAKLKAETRARWDLTGCFC